MIQKGSNSSKIERPWVGGVSCLNLRGSSYSWPHPPQTLSQDRLSVLMGAGLRVRVRHTWGRQDLRDSQDFLSFLKKGKSLKPSSREFFWEQRTMKKRHDRPAIIQSTSLAFFPAESGIGISRVRLETEKAIDPINPVNPVQLPKSKFSLHGISTGVEKK